MQTCVCAHTPPPWLQGHTHTLPWVLPTLPIPGKAQTCSQAPAWLPGPSGPPAPSQDMPPTPPDPDTHTTAGAHPEPSRAVVFVMAKAVGGLNALNGPDTWIGLTPLPPPPPPAVLVQQPEAPYGEMPQGRGCPRCPRWDSARDTCRCQLTERWAGDRRNRAHLLYTIVSFTEAELETFWVPPGHSG